MIDARRAAAAALVLGLAGAAAASARPPIEIRPLLEPAEIPEQLFLEVVTAPGYDWMEACLQAGSAPAADAGRTADAGHAAHHPPKAGPASPPLGEAGLEKHLAALKDMIDTLERMRPGLGGASGTQPWNSNR